MSMRADCPDAPLRRATMEDVIDTIPVRDPNGD
jgi:hypothetical protein